LPAIFSLNDAMSLNIVILSQVVSPVKPLISGEIASLLAVSGVEAVPSTTAQHDASPPPANEAEQQR
jgi:hypothetical protein